MKELNDWTENVTSNIQPVGSCPEGMVKMVPRQAGRRVQGAGHKMKQERPSHALLYCRPQ